MQSSRPEHAAFPRRGSQAPVGIGVVGAGYWGPRLIRNFRNAEGAEVVCVCDSDPKRLAGIERSAPGAAAVASLDEMLARPDVDAVAIATPVSTHYPLAKKALESGRHVLVEKPMAARSEEAEELCELARANDLTLLVDHTFLYHPAVHEMLRAYRAGELGKLLYFDSVRINLGLFQSDVNVLWDLAPHDLSILTALRPEMPETVTAVGASHWGQGTENIAYLTLRYADDFIAHIHASWLAPVKVRQTILCGDRRMLIYDDTQVVEKIKVYDRGFTEDASSESRHARRVEYRTGDVYSPHVPGDEPLANEVDDFLTCIRTGATPIGSGASGLAVAHLLEKAQESIRLGGRPVAVRACPELVAPALTPLPQGGAA